MSRMTLRATAYHEAGHAVASVKLRIRMKYATIVPSDEYLGLVRNEMPSWWEEGMEYDPRFEKWLEKQSICTLAGGIAEQAFTGKTKSDGAGHDFEQLADMA